MAKKRSKSASGRTAPTRGNGRQRERMPREPSPQRGRARNVEAPRPKAPVAAPPVEAVPAPSLLAEALPVVGIGASAGGLEALEVFLRNVPERSGVAWVIVQHLDPKDRGTMVALLQRACAMPVVQVTDRQPVEADHVYVIPPNRDMSILHGVLHLLPQAAPRGLNLPVDVFFRSLAADRQERGISVVLSGMGSDGTLGVRAIKEKGGAAFVQSLDSAKFDGMPRSAIDTGLVDVISDAADLPGRIVAYIRHAVHGPQAAPDERVQSALEKIFILLRNHTGNDFSQYKRSTIQRRIERRMGLHQLDRMLTYLRFLRENPKEVDLLFKELLIGVTSFFRDPAAWEHLEKHVLPELVAARASAGTLRAWVPGCSTGEEAYSLAIILREAIAAKNLAGQLAIQIFATDLDGDAIEKARVGAYPANIAADVSPDRLRRFFVQDDRGYRVSKEIRESVVFAPQNIAMDPPFTKLDLLSCRNLLIYLSAELQKKIIPLFHYSLLPGGVLFLGSAETVGTFSNVFQALDGKTRLYRRLDTALGLAAIEFPAVFTAPMPHEPPGSRDKFGEPPRATAPNLQMVAERVLVQRWAPTAIVTTEKGDVLYTSGRTGKYLEPAVGRANLNVFAMAREGLRYELSAAFATALKEDRAVIVRGLRIGTNGGSQHVDVTVQRMSEPKELRNTVMIVIADVVAPPPGREAPAPRKAATTRLAHLERELQQAREEVQTTREEMQTSQEELKSMNEELQSTNEELQSTNEELTTSKEEMQSMNEELQTVNHELQAKVDELSRSNNDMKNLLNSTDIATLFLDGELHVRRFTTQTSRIIKLIPGDTGRPITDIATDLEYTTLVDDAREVLRSLVFQEKQVPTKSGRWYTVRILPYRTLENVIDGVVITFTDVTETKVLEERLRHQATELRRMTDALPTFVWGSRADGSCEYLSRGWLDYTGVTETEQLGWGWLDQVHPDDRERLRDAWRGAVREGAPLDVDIRIRAKSGDFRWFKTRAIPIRDGQGAPSKWYGTHTDVDELKLEALSPSGAAGEGAETS
jgi:two-component system CheB/CheR fusion protein